MNFDLKYILNLYSLFILLILLASIILKKEDFKYSSRLLKTVIIGICTLLVFEIFSWAFDGIDATYAKILNYFFNSVFFVLGTYVVGLFVSYVDYLNMKDTQRIKKRLFYSHVGILSSILIIINFFTPIIFKISSDNVYSRQPFMNFVFICVFLLVLYTLVLTYRNRKNLNKEELISIFVFTLVPVIGGVLQMIFYGLLIMWAFIGLGVIIAYIYTDTISNSKDYLTKLYTRLITDEYINSLIERNEVFSMILLDLDNFKDINDTFGHKEGDRVLINFSRLLKETFSKEDFISRFGGDEFLVITKSNNINVVMDYLKDLYNRTSKYNVTHHNVLIKYSSGSATRTKTSNETADELFVRCDAMMYKEKESHRRNKLLEKEAKKVLTE